jgi:DNA-directed RNA polymerase specialized sigma24 family protein
MSTDESVSIWIKEVMDGNGDAAQKLWDRYFPDLMKLARKRLRTVPRRMVDEEDVALSALKSFFGAAQKGRFPDLADRDSLWRLLSRMTQRKAVDVLRRHLAQKRGGDAVLGESQLHAPSSINVGLAQFASDDIGPELTAIVTEQCQLLMGSLEDPQLRQIALAKLEGYTNEEISKQLDLAIRTVERRLQLIRKTWEEHQKHDR